MNKPISNDYLWSGGGEVDPHVAELEKMLAPLRYVPRVDKIVVMPPAAPAPRSPQPA